MHPQPKCLSGAATRVWVPKGLLPRMLHSEAGPGAWVEVKSQGLSLAKDSGERRGRREP